MTYYPGSRIKQLRELKRMSLADISGLTGIAVSQLSKIENGKVDPRISTIVRILTCLGAALSDLSPSGVGTVTLDEVLDGASRGARILDQLGYGRSDPDARLDWKERRAVDVSAERAALATRL